jgi:LSD1 subclass zinc finger protein
METFDTVNQSTLTDELVCVSCAGTLSYKPGTNHLKCGYCGAMNEIASPDGKTEIKETNLDEFLIDNFEAEEKIQVTTVQCDGCGASSTLAPNVTSDNCPFCSSPLVVESGSVCNVHKPQYLLPFKVESKEALGNFRTWIKKLWFAPNDLTKYAQNDKLNGIYVPFWTYDCNTFTDYSGQRGIHYQVQQKVTVMQDGKPVTRTKTVTKTKWYFVSGRVNNFFDDILVPATRSMNREKLNKLEPWDLPELVGYNDKFLSGFKTENYQVSLKEGYQEAKTRMQSKIEESIKRDIGGDAQRIISMSTDYKDPSFKHILLPVWISAFKYKNKVYQFLVNARTGEVQGERPYSVAKITMLVLTILAFFGLLFMLA